MREDVSLCRFVRAADLDGPVDKFPWYNMLSAETSGIGLSTENWRKMVENNADWAAINEKGGVGMPKL